MTKLAIYEFKKTVRRKDAIALLVLGLWPAVVTVCTSLGTGLFHVSSDPVGAFEFVNMLFSFQDMLFLPVLIGVYIASMSLYQEIHTKQIYLYKDMKKSRILNVKYISIFSVYGLFLIIYISTAFIFYYLMFQYDDVATGSLIAYESNLIPLLYNSFEITLGVLFYIHVGITLVLRVSTGIAIFGTTLFYMVALITPELHIIKYIFPIGYKNVIEFEQHSYLWSWILSIIVWLIYNVGLYYFNRKHFDKLEYD